MSAAKPETIQWHILPAGGLVRANYSERVVLRRAA